MRNTVLILAVLTWMGGVALSDDVTVGDLPFADVKVLRVADCNVVFQTSVGNRVTRPLSEVQSLKIAGSRS